MSIPKISRRRALRGLGTAVALPWLEAMGPVRQILAAAESAPAVPLRMAFLYVPNGAHMPDWTPTTDGPGYALPHILEPLAGFKDDFSVMTGLSQVNARALGDGGGDHARAMSTFLTGTHPLKTGGAHIKAGISVDQVAAQKVGRATRFASVELGCDRGAQSGSCDTGYSCAYSSNISWRSEATPSGKEINPRLVFERLFANDTPGETDSSRHKRLRYRQSILDFVTEDAQALKTRLGVGDRRKVDEYLTSVRELEIRISRSDQDTEADTGDFPKPYGIPKEYAEHVRMMCDLLVLAFQGDVTRIATFAFANEGSTKSYGFLGVPEGHHDLSHHGGDPRKHEKLKIINRFHIGELAHMLGRLKATPEGDANLLDHSMIVYGSAIADGNRHAHHDLPILLAGRGGGTIRPGRHIRYASETPLNNLYLSMLDRLGSPVDSLGDSTGRLPMLED